MKDIRYDLVPPKGLEEVCKVLTSKLEKYNKNEWKFGLKWSDVLSSLKKHLSEFEQGHDFTPEGALSIAEVAANALILADFYSSYPYGDDRSMCPIKKPIIALDLDDTIFSFREAYEERFGVKLADYWDGDYNMGKNLDELTKDKDFWTNLKVKNFPNFEVSYYVTARNIPIEWTQESIQRNNLPKATIYTLPWNESKIDLLKQLKVDIMVDDKYQTFKECNENGIFCYLMDNVTNQRYDVGHKRIFDLNLKLF